MALGFAGLLLGGTCGCSRGAVTTLPEGGYRITCERGMKDCVTRADKLCGKDGYTIVHGATHKHLLGGSSSSYRAMAENGELEVQCGIDPAEEKREEVPYVQLPPRSDEPPAHAPSACVPGATQLCVGAGACQGGQVCLADGSGFGPCDCGTTSTKPSEPAPAGPSSSEGPQPPASGPTTPAPVVPGAAPAAEPLR